MSRIHVLLAVALLALSGRELSAKESCSCGCVEAPRKICRVVPDVQTVTRFEYYCQRETICVPGRSRCVLPPCEVSTPGSPCEKACKIWVPTCGPVFERSQLYKRPVVCQRQIYRYVVEDVCNGCGQARIDEAATRAMAFTRELPAGAWQPIDAAPDGRIRSLAVQNKLHTMPAGQLAGGLADQAEPIPVVGVAGMALPVGYEGPMTSGEAPTPIRPLPPVGPAATAESEQPANTSSPASASQPESVAPPAGSPAAGPAVRKPQAVSSVFGPPTIALPEASSSATAASTTTPGKDPAQGQQDPKAYAGRMSNAWEGPYAQPDLMKPRKPGFWERLLYGD